MAGFRRINRGRNHTYQDGERAIVGVTTIISKGLPKPALVSWAARETAEFAADHVGLLNNLEREEAVDLLKGAPWRDRDRAANRGTEVHGLAEKLAQGVEVDVPEELVGHVDAYLKWREEWQPTEEMVEVPVLNRTWRYAGTADRISLIDGKRTLIDFKTNRSGPFGEVALQLCAYGRAEVYLDGKGREQPMPEIEQYLCVWLKADGYEVLRVDVGEREWQTFLWIYEVGRWLEERADRNASQRVLGPMVQRPEMEVAS